MRRTHPAVRRPAVLVRSALVPGLVALSPWLCLSTAGAQEAAVTERVVVTAPKPGTPDARRKASTSDAAKLLDGAPGVTVYEAGGVSGLPAVRGLADDRVRVQVDGMDLMASCPNHMNSPLSYIDASRVDSIKVLAGASPVSMGGDSIAGTIAVSAPPPRFAEQQVLSVSGQAGAFVRSNGRARGLNLHLEAATDTLSLAYSGSTAQSDNVHAGQDFKPAGPAALGRRWLDADEVGSTAFKARNHDLALALRSDGHLLQLNVGRQDIPFELYPNQRMDMTGNESTQLNLRYTGQQAWGQLKMRAYDQRVRHAMDMGPDRYSYGTGMPMDTKTRTSGGALQADIALAAEDTLRVGVEAQAYYLYDWWSPVGTGMMAPNTFWNVDYGTRDRAGAFAEWETRWSAQWSSQIGLRHDQVRADAGPVQGYSADPIWADDAAAFNARNRQRTTRHWDWTLQSRFEASAEFSVEGGLARKTRSPNLYERYPWSTQPMATLMNNFVGDGNGYIGNPDLRPEVAHTLSLSAQWREPGEVGRRLQAAVYTTHVRDFIDARRCASAMCGGLPNVNATTGFVNLQYVNQSARLTGVDVTLDQPLGRWQDHGEFDLKATLGYIRGKNLSTGDDLYHQMPVHAEFTLSQTDGAWTRAIEWRVVGAKTRVSAVRNETPTPGYALLNLHTSVDWNRWRLEMAINNLFDRGYELPLGGAYAGQGASMSTTSLPWGQSVPGRGRSVDLSASVRF